MSKETKKKKYLVSNIILIILFAIIAFCAVRIGSILYNYHIGTNAYNDARSIADLTNGVINWDKLEEKYPNVRAWLVQDDTVIDYPVAQSKDNSYYLTHLIDDTYNVKGCLFVDYRNNAFNDDLTVIFGHRMKDKSMFWSLGDMRDQDYFDKHKTFKLYTKKANYTLEVVSVMTIPADDPIYHNFNYGNKSAKQAFLNRIISGSEVKTGVTASTSDKLVAFSTCTYEYDDARCVVFTKLVKEDSK